MEQLEAFQKWRRGRRRKGWSEEKGRDECSTLVSIDKMLQKKKETFCDTLQMYEITL